MASNNTLFVNLPVASLPGALAFYAAIGFEQNHEYSDETAAMTTLSPKVSETPLTIMLLTHNFFKGFIGEQRKLGEKSHAEMILCVSMPSKEAVDEMLEKVKAAGGQTGVTASMGMPGMYGGSFADLDGHLFELLHTEENFQCSEKQA